MPRKVPDFVKKFTLTNITTGSVTYHLQPEGERGFGWALATINDATGELTIQSDWGNWAYRWPHRGMAEINGRRETLTEFIAGRFGARTECDYLANKLTTHEERHVFDAELTVEWLRSELCKHRLEQGRNLIEFYDDEPDAPRVWDDLGESRLLGMERKEIRLKYSTRTEELPLTKSLARSLWDALGDIDHHRDVRDFVTSFYEIEGNEWIAQNIEFEGDLKYEPSTSYYQLLYGILPALVDACVGRLATQTPLTTPAPAVTP